MGESLRDFMDYQGVNICGTNGKELSRQIHNLAAARISLGVWSGEHARHAQIADTIDFWLEKDRRQRTLWQPVMRVSEPYATAVREHCVPHDMRALIGLYKNTRAMDIYVWLSYRLPRIPNHHPLFLRYVDLKPVFGTSIRELRKFRELFRHALRDALAWYRDARVGIEPDGIRLFNSPSPVPIDVARSPYGRTVAGGRRRLRVVIQPDD
jgi:Plasmid encoded RepA protein